MKILKTMISFTDDQPGCIFYYDTIEHDGKFWIVPEWHVNMTLRKRKPTRIIPLDQFGHQVIDRDLDPDFEADFVVTNSVPSAVFYGKKDNEFFAIEDPEIFDDAPELIH